MLTGDKLETAVNIAHSCGHFKRGTELMELNHQNMGVERTDEMLARFRYNILQIIILKNFIFYLFFIYYIIIIYIYFIFILFVILLLFIFIYLYLFFVYFYLFIFIIYLNIYLYRKRLWDEPHDNIGMVIDGESLAVALKDHRQLLTEICSQCTAVVCCRMSPLQKAEVRIHVSFFSWLTRDNIHCSGCEIS